MREDLLSLGLGTPLFLHPSVRQNLDQLYSSINHHRTTINLSGAGLAVSGAYLVVSSGVWSMSYTFLHVSRP